MENYGIAGDTVRKAESFFVNAAKDLEISMSASLKKLARNRAPQTKSGAQGTARRSPRKPPEQTPERRTTTPSPSEQTLQAEAQQSLMLWGLFKRLPAPGSEFSRRDREAWIVAAQTLFDLEYESEEDE